jgi:SAM-dependent methyltransferase
VAKIDRREGRSLFGLDPAAYDRVRPDYPERVYDLLRERCDLTASTRVLEIGAGSGNVTRRLIELGAGSVVAIEPDEALAGYLSSTVPDVEVRVEAFEDTALPDSSFDLAIAATAFHWIDQNIGLRKIYQLLRPGGWWAMWANVFGDPDKNDAFHEATKDILEPLAQSPSEGEMARPPFALDIEARRGDLADAGFENVEYELMRWTLVLTAVETRALYATYGSISRLEPEAREKLLDHIASIADEEFGGRVQRNMITSIYAARKPS